MTVSANSLSSVFTSAYSNTRVNMGSDNSSSSFSVTSSTTPELTEEEKLYDTDGDGVLSVTEKEAYAKDQAAKKSAKVAASVLEYSEDKKQTIQKMWNESSLARQAGLSRIQPPEKSGDAATAKTENSKQTDDSKISSMKRHAIEMYTATVHQFPCNIAAYKFSIAV